MGQSLVTLRLLVIAMAFACHGSAEGQSAAAEPSATDLAKTTQNPVGDRDLFFGK